MRRRQISRRELVQSSLLASAAVPLGLAARGEPTIQDSAAKSTDSMPMGKIGSQEFSRLILGGNPFGGYSHARDLAYVANLMLQYNTTAKIRETLEVAEAQGINVVESWVMQPNEAIFEHWKNGGKIKWISQVRLDERGGFDQLQKAADQGAVGIHLTGDACERLLKEGTFEKVGESIDFIKTRKLVAGVAAHDLRVIVECEKHKLEPDFYQKTFHSLDYYSAPRPDETGPMGKHDNSWCNDPDAVTEVMAKTNKPWVAFKVLAAGAIPPRIAFPHAFNSGADFVLVGMFDWQVKENAQLAKQVVHITSGPDSKRTRSWFS